LVNVVRCALQIILATVLSLAFIPVVWALFSAFEADIALYQASRIAGAKPYCIVVADKDHPSRYLEVTHKRQPSYPSLTVPLLGGGSKGPFADIPITRC
jgi:hypothetical protein